MCTKLFVHNVLLLLLLGPSLSAIEFYMSTTGTLSTSSSRGSSNLPDSNLIHRSNAVDSRGSNRCNYVCLTGSYSIELLKQDTQKTPHEEPVRR